METAEYVKPVQVNGQDNFTQFVLVFSLLTLNE